MILRMKTPPRLTPMIALVFVIAGAREAIRSLRRSPGAALMLVAGMLGLVTALLSCPWASTR
jgi:uncharacterized membrane protein HdeD (DUF308 family)